ncbi:DNA/RNA helicase of DEAD/DEAH box family [Microbacterium esteraromaticum]|uniref:DNA/RNA helicase of DEAD/DEAH box family n=1 Tax=Microbacterium esteraromaticum TaxID=57043 RepID=A0A1R4IMW6_9MICO|nr:DEAD/DEAH box helicase [Microbacterium esteraromaticum]SJN21191.1 DNA/RNA helicase of DEAD/DEAH box family [Microbacterium esteraromaticum]
METPLQQLRLDNAFGFLDKSVQSDQLYHPLLVANNGANTMLRAIRHELRRSLTFTFSTAFVTTSAIAMLKQVLLDFPGKGTIITSTYLGFNSPAAFRELLNLPGVDVFVYSSVRGGFHAKGYLFEQPQSTTAIVGSSNLTETALLTNQEWNLRFSALPDGDIVDQLQRAINTQLTTSVPLTQSWIADYEKTYVPPAPRTILAPRTSATTSPLGPVTPNAMQSEALLQLQKVRDVGERRAVIVSATGTGKTILSALDVRSVAPERMLFVVHREQILDRAIEEFSRVLNAPIQDFGKFVGTQRELDRKYVFSTIQSLSRAENLLDIPAGHFDYVLIDEVHRAGAASYRRVIDHLKPDFLLGMTATPERTDDFNVFELFDFNVPYEIRLQQALEEDMLAPFHYYGVTDFIQGDDVIDDASQLAMLVAPERADHIISAIETYGHTGSPARGLMFCSRKEEVRELASLLNTRAIHGRKLRTTALTGDDPIHVRESVVTQLENGELDYILTVDVFNEGIDIPSVNQVVMLRQTKSSIVFTQQLGRGLRKAAGKDHLVVIDFIGNYTNNYLIPIALFGDNSLNKDSIRKKIIDAQEAGAISGLSSVNFDKISRQRIFSSLAATKLDSIQNLKRTIAELENRLNRPPALLDFARFDTADPVVVACKRGNYWNLLHALKKTNRAPSGSQTAWLTFISNEILNGKRPHELILIRALLDAPGRAITESAYRQLLLDSGASTEPATLSSVMRIVTLEFFTEAERAKYGSPIAMASDHQITLNPELAASLNGDGEFAGHFEDVIETGLYLARHRYQWSNGLEVGQRYSRKDACRLLNWEKNEQSTMYGYKVDYTSLSCPIFITYHKHEDVSASTAYGDEFLNESSLHWFTRSRRTLQSGEVKAIVENRIPLHLFAKKDDAEGTDFYYLGEARSSNAQQTKMPESDGAPLDVVTMTLGMESPLEQSLYEYLVGAGS